MLKASQFRDRGITLYRWMAPIAGQRPVRRRAQWGTTHHSRALLPPFDPGGSPSARASHRNLTTPGSGHWCGRQVPGNPGIGGTRHSRVGGNLVCPRATGVDINAGRSVSVHRVTVLLELTNGARVVAACPLPLLGAEVQHLRGLSAAIPRLRRPAASGCPSSRGVRGGAGLPDSPGGAPALGASVARVRLLTSKFPLEA